MTYTITAFFLDDIGLKKALGTFPSKPQEFLGFANVCLQAGERTVFHDQLERALIFPVDTPFQKGMPCEDLEEVIPVHGDSKSAYHMLITQGREALHNLRISDTELIEAAQAACA